MLHLIIKFFKKSTLDLISVLLRNTKQTQLPELMSSAFFHVINLCIKADDTAILQVKFQSCFIMMIRSKKTLFNFFSKRKERQRVSQSLHFEVNRSNRALERRERHKRFKLYCHGDKSYARSENKRKRLLHHRQANQHTHSSDSPCTRRKFRFYSQSSPQQNAVI